MAVHEPNAAIRKKWMKDIVRSPKRWAALQKAVGLELIEDPLGCGSFGCVFAAADPESPWVVKLTIDQHEAAMWQTILELAESDGYGEEGYTQVKEIVRLKPDLISGKKRPRKLKTYAIVREAIAPLVTDNGWSDFSKRVVAPAALPGWVLPRWGSNVQLETIDRPARDLIEVVMWISKYHEAARYIYERRPWHRGTPGSPHYGPVSIDDARMKLQRSIDMMKTGYGYVLGDTLEMLWGNGIVLNDLRPSNVGWRFLPQFLPENEDNVLVMFDPGYTATVKRELPELREAFIENPGFEWYVPENIAR